MNQLELSNPSFRIAIYLAWMSLLWAIEFGIPLVPGKRRSIVSNLILTVLALSIYAGFGGAVVGIDEWTRSIRFGLFRTVSVDPWIALVLTILLLDFWSSYVAHRLMHAYGWAWRVHSVHHTDLSIDITTSLRQHPFESLLRILFLLTGMILLGASTWMVLVYQTVSSFSAVLEHANIKINRRIDRMFSWVFVTPNFHRVHHSSIQIETDSNYGNIFTIWDRLFQTYRSRDSYQDIKFGLDYIRNNSELKAAELLKLPFLQIPEEKNVSEKLKEVDLD